MSSLITPEDVAAARAQFAGQLLMCPHCAGRVIDPRHYGMDFTGPVTLVAEPPLAGMEAWAWGVRCWNPGCGAASLNAMTAEDRRGRRTLEPEGRVMKYERHGHAPVGAQSAAYRSWAAMLQRCYNPRNKRFANYGGRGIGVCQEWRAAFSAFFRDMGDRPAGKTLDRREVDRDYMPSNCRWATAREQALNRRPRTISETCRNGPPANAGAHAVKANGRAPLSHCAVAPRAL